MMISLWTFVKIAISNIHVNFLEKNIDINIDIDKEIWENIDIEKEIFENIDFYINKDILENINIDKEILENIATNDILN